MALQPNHVANQPNKAKLVLLESLLSLQDLLQVGVLHL